MKVQFFAAALSVLFQTTIVAAASFDGSFSGNGNWSSTAGESGKTYVEWTKKGPAIEETITLVKFEPKTGAEVVMQTFVDAYLVEPTAQPYTFKLLWLSNGQKLEAGTMTATSLQYTGKVVQPNITSNEQGFMSDENTLVRLGEFTMQDGRRLFYNSVLKRKDNH